MGKSKLSMPKMPAVPPMVKNVLKDKRALYASVLFASASIFGYMNSGNMEALILFCLIGVILTRFTKNMTIVILGAIAGTHLISWLRKGIKREGMEDMEEGEEEDDETDDEGEEGEGEGEEGVNIAVAMAKKMKKKGKKVIESTPPTIAEGFDKVNSDPNVDFAATLEQAYDNLDGMLGKDGANKWGGDMEKLFGKQQKLMQNIEKIEPMIDKMGGMMSSMNKFGAKLGGMGNKKAVM
jgi:hypothetical protein